MKQELLYIEKIYIYIYLSYSYVPIHHNIACKSLLCELVPFVGGRNPLIISFRLFPGDQYHPQPLEADGWVYMLERRIQQDPMDRSTASQSSEFTRLEKKTKEPTDEPCQTLTDPALLALCHFFIRCDTGYCVEKSCCRACLLA